jgi:hypothetical protein
VVTGGTDSLIMSLSGQRVADTADYRLNKFNAISGMNEKVKNAVRAAIDTNLRTEIGGRSDFDGLDVWVNGNSQFAIGSGSAAAGFAKIKLSGLEIGFRARFSGFRWGHWSCESNVTIRNVNLSNGDLNVNSGTVLNWILTSATPEVRQDCSHVLGFIPGVGDFVEGQLNGRFSEFAAGVSALLGNGAAVTLKAVGFMSLDQAVSVGTSVGGQDLGILLRNDSKEMLAAGVSISLADEVRMPTDTGGWSPIIFQSTYKDGFTIELRKERTVVWRCPKPPLQCDI